MSTGPVMPHLLVMPATQTTDLVSVTPSSGTSTNDIAKAFGWELPSQAQKMVSRGIERFFAKETVVAVNQLREASAEALRENNLRIYGRARLAEVLANQSLQPVQYGRDLQILIEELQYAQQASQSGSLKNYVWATLHLADAKMSLGKVREALEILETLTPMISDSGYGQVDGMILRDQDAFLTRNFLIKTAREMLMANRPRAKVVDASSSQKANAKPRSDASAKSTTPNDEFAELEQQVRETLDRGVEVAKSFWNKVKKAVGDL